MPRAARRADVRARRESLAAALLPSATFTLSLVLGRSGQARAEPSALNPWVDASRP